MPPKKSTPPAPADHPIYGSAGPMRGILWPGYGIDNAYPKAEWKVFGDNGCVVGMCWAKQAAAVRDGAHGKHMSGVSGNTYDGIYSIVVSKGENEDSGNELWYLPSGNSTTSSIANEAALATDDCLMFAKSIATQEPVRVLRATSAKSQFSPKIGIRYDGLYQVDRVESVATDAGGSYVRFHLTRMPGQADIDTNLPNDTDAAVFAEVPKGY